MTIDAALETFALVEEPPAKMPPWRYVFADLLTDQTLVELSLEGVVFDRRIIVPGAFKATIPVPNATVARRVQRAFPNTVAGLKTGGPGRTIVHVYRGRQIWGTYIIWTAQLDSDEKGRVSVAIQGASLESYLAHREIRADEFVFLSDDQTSQIALSLVLDMQQEIEGNIGLVPVCPPSGVLRDRTYLRSEAATYHKRLEELANVENGFEWAIETYAEDNQRIREFRTGYPGLGQSVAPHELSQPGNVTSWSWLLDATDTATNWQTRGDSVNDDIASDSEPLMSSEWKATELLGLGWPLLDATRDYSGVTVTSTLNNYARWWRDTHSGVIAIPQASVRLGPVPIITPAHLGDVARLRLRNVWWPDGFVASWRMVGMEITPRQRGHGQDRCKVIFEAGEE